VFEQTSLRTTTKPAGRRLFRRSLGDGGHERRQAMDMANTAQQHEQHAARTLEHGIDRDMSLRR
jgi:hypothetical protein